MLPKDLSIPEGLDLVEAQDGTTLLRKWRSWKVVPLIFFVIAWDSFLIFWYGMAFTSKEAPWLMIVFPIGHVAVGVGLTYYVLASLFNKTRIVCNPLGVRVRTSPIPWFGGNKMVWTQEIGHLRIRDKYDANNPTTYMVMYADNNRKERRLVAGLPEWEQADFIARVVSATVGRPYRGE